MNSFKKFLMIVGLGVVSTTSFATESSSADEFKKKIDAIMNQERVLIVETPEVYIHNINTTDFMKGLMYETTMVIRFIKENSKDKDKLAAFNKEFSLNAKCFSIVIGNSGKHFDTLYALTLKTDEDKEKFKEGYSFMINTLPRVNISQEDIALCEKEKQNVIEHYNKHKKS